MWEQIAQKVAPYMAEITVTPIQRSKSQVPILPNAFSLLIRKRRIQTIIEIINDWITMKYTYQAAYNLCNTPSHPKYNLFICINSCSCWCQLCSLTPDPEIHLGRNIGVLCCQNNESSASYVISDDKKNRALEIILGYLLASMLQWCILFP